MGWGIGNGIGWPNATYNSTGTAFTVFDCVGHEVILYSDSNLFLPGTIVYEDPEKTHPFDGGEGFWNLSNLIHTIGGYRVEINGTVVEPLTTCPI
jgi:hypothetical protein